MKKIRIKKLDLLPNADLETISRLLDEKRKHAIDTVNWSEFCYKPDVKLSICYSDSELLIKFYVTENGVRAVNGEANTPVYQDSCVEFFTKPVSDGPYKNFEFNAIGTCLSQVGMDRNSRDFVDAEQIATIRRLSSLGSETFEEKPGEHTWSLLVAIPFTLIFGEAQPDLSGKIIRSNFYKCGDKLSQVHYLSWNPIETEDPDFHRPEFFGVLEFE